MERSLARVCNEGIKLKVMDSFTSGSEDIPVTVTITSDGTTALDTSNFTEVSVSVAHKKYNTEIGSYTFTGGTVSKGSPTSDGKVTFIVSRSDTSGEPKGVYEYTITTQESDASYESNIRYRSYTGDCLYLKA